MRIPRFTVESPVRAGLLAAIGAAGLFVAFARMSIDNALTLGVCFLAALAIAIGIDGLYGGKEWGVVWGLVLGPVVITLRFVYAMFVKF